MLRHTHNPSAGINKLTLLQRAMHDPTMDLEYLQHMGIFYISRFVPDQRMVRRFQEQQDEAAIGTPLKDAGAFQLSIKQVGRMDTINFVTDRIHDSPLNPGFVEVESKILRLNAKIGLLQKVSLLSTLYSQLTGCTCTLRTHRYQ